MSKNVEKFITVKSNLSTLNCVIYYETVQFWIEIEDNLQDRAAQGGFCQI